MASQEPYLDAMASVVSEWNKAEKAIKLAEQVNGEIVNPAIYELRYAGRRMIEAEELRKSSKADDKQRSVDRLRDAHFDCCRARHDAIDAATSKVAADLDIAVAKLGAGNVMKSFPEIHNLISMLGSVRDKIAVSREKRDDRDAIYAAIETDNLVEIVAIFRRFKSSEGLMKQAAKGERRTILLSYGLGGLGAVAGVAQVIISYFFGA